MQTRRLLTRLYRLAGRRYPALLVFGTMVSLYLVYGSAVGLLSIYVDVSGGEALRLVAVYTGLHTLYVVGISRAAARRLRPVARWIGGERDAATTATAFRTAVTMPDTFLAGDAFGSNMRGITVAGLLVGCGFTVWETGLPITSLPIILVGGFVVQLYAFTMFYFVIEEGLQPILEDIAPSVPEDVAGARDVAGLPLRVRLLVAIPIINLITGVVVAGLSTTGDASVRDLGIDVGVAVAVAMTVSLWLAVLLVRSIVIPVDRLRAATERLGAGDLTVRVPPTRVDETGALARSFNRLASGLQERDRLRDAFGTFVDPALAERVAREGLPATAEEVDASVLFLDVRGFTALAERETPHAVVARLNDLYELVVPILLRHGGHANKFVGDGLVAVFGAPERHADHAQRAVAAALEVADAVRAVPGGLQVGLGINSGRVLFGAVGGGGRLDFTVIGDAVNTASRVERATRETGDDVLVTDATLERLGSFDGWRERPATPLKGKGAPVRLFAPAES